MFRQGANDTVLFPAVENPPAHQHFVTGAGKEKGRGGGKGESQRRSLPTGESIFAFFRS